MRRPLRSHLAAPAGAHRGPERDGHPAAPRPPALHAPPPGSLSALPSPGRDTSPSWEHQIVSLPPAKPPHGRFHEDEATHPQSSHDTGHRPPHPGSRLFPEGLWSVTWETGPTARDGGAEKRDKFIFGAGGAAAAGRRGRGGSLSVSLAQPAETRKRRGSPRSCDTTTPGLLDRLPRPVRLRLWPSPETNWFSNS